MGRAEPRSHQSMANSTTGVWEILSLTIQPDFSWLPIPLGKKSNSAEVENASYRCSVGRMIAFVKE